MQQKVGPVQQTQKSVSWESVTCDPSPPPSGFFERVISELPRSIAAKLCHMIRNWFNFIMQVKKFRRGASPKKFGAKKCKILVDFIQPPILIANISATAQDIQNLKAIFFQIDYSCVLGKRSGELWSPNYRDLDMSLDPLKCTFWDTIFRPLGGAVPWNFYTRYRLTKPC